MSKVAPIRKNQLSFLSKDRHFGTDGIRGPVTTTMNPLFVTKLGWAAVKVSLKKRVSQGS